MSVALTLFRRFLYLIVGIAVVAGLLLFSMRFADGPAGIVAGGAFTSGEQHRGAEPDWTLIKDRQEVEFQLLRPERSRTTWVMEHQGRIYIPCGYMNTTWGRIWKQWPIEAQTDGRAILRIDDTLYDRQLVRVREGSQIPHLLQELARKYFQTSASATSSSAREQTLIAMAQQVETGSLWIFELTPR